MDERITIPVGVAPPEEFAPLPPISEDLVEPDIFNPVKLRFCLRNGGQGDAGRPRHAIASVVVHIVLLR